MGSLCNYCHAMHICCSLCSWAPRQSCLPVSLGTESSWRLSLTSITVLPQTRTRHVVDTWHTCTISKHVQQYRFTTVVCIHLYYMRLSFVSFHIVMCAYLINLCICPLLLLPLLFPICVCIHRMERVQCGMQLPMAICPFWDSWLASMVAVPVWMRRVMYVQYISILQSNKRCACCLRIHLASCFMLCYCVLCYELICL